MEEVVSKEVMLCVYRKLSELKKLPNNPRTIRKEDFEKLKTSLKNNPDYFEARPLILSNRTGELVIIAGNQRYDAAKALGMDEVPTVLLEGLTEEREREIIIRDNVSNGEWDMDALANDWEIEDLQEWGVDIDWPSEALSDVDKDEAPDVAADAPVYSKAGEVYQLGNHRLMCGDSTKPEDVAKLMGGEQADCIVTDPPYNVALGSHDTPEDARQRNRRTDGLLIANDSMDDAGSLEFLTKCFTNGKDNLKKGGAFYIWYAGNEGLNFMLALKNSGMVLRENLVWVKNTISLGRQDYQWKHEPCLYGWKDGASHYFVKDRSLPTVLEDVDIDHMDVPELRKYIRDLWSKGAESTVLYGDKPAKSPEHPTMKPVNLITRQIRNSTRKHEIVLDLFGGSGTTLIACEDLDRQCRMMEFDPKYCDVIRKRWWKYTTGSEEGWQDGTKAIA